MLAFDNADRYNAERRTSEEEDVPEGYVPTCRKFFSIAAAAATAVMLAACSPTVRLEVPDKPIVINLNIKIEQEVRVKLERGVEDAIKRNPGIF